MPVVGSDGIYEIEGRKYIDIDNIRIKVPWRYNKIHGVKMDGLKTLYELKKGEKITSFECTKKIWNGSSFYVLKYINTD